MRDLFRDAEHLFRLATVFLVLLVVFLAARALLIPEGFGTYGHYRGGALQEARARELRFAGRDACLDCHEDIATTKMNAKHAGVGCEACHGPLQAHVAEPSTVVPEKHDANALCLVCHAENLAKPRGFPQINPKEHAGEDHCITCHDPHAPLPLKE
jgi:hypothetical protein